MHLDSLLVHLKILLPILVVAISCFLGTCDGSCNELEHDSLSSFNLSITAAPPLLNWSLSIDCCTWEGVSCDSSSRVTTLWLPSRGLVGQISPSIMNLTTLSILNLSRNALSGPLPHGFFTSFLTLSLIDLSLNHLSGALSVSDPLPNTVQMFNLSSNSFHGTIPSSFLEKASKLQAFDVKNNSFFGSLPSSICNSSPTIHSLDFSNNDFAGLIPSSFGQCSNLQCLRAGFNNLSGQIPPEIYSLSMLQELYLPGNKLSGVIDQRITSLTNLKILKLYGNELRGMIPRDIGRLFRLEHLQLHINSLNGSIPPSLTNCTRLITLNLRVNSLEGELSSFDFSRFVQLKSVDLGNNMFEGSLPETLFECKTLTAIRLASNNLSGQILPQIVSLPSLSFLSLSKNSLTNITSALRILTQCKNLTILTLSKNFKNEQLPGGEDDLQLEGFQNLKVLAIGVCGLTGTFPLWLSNSKLPNLEVLDLSLNSLTGPVPGWIGSFQELFYLDLSNNQLTGDFPIELTSMQRLAFKQSSHVIDSSYLELPVFVAPESNASTFQYNQLSSLPTAIYLGNNSLNGTLPTAIDQLKFIIALDLSGNHFSGVIPDTFSNLTNLEKLDISRNHLSGQIPSSLRNLHFLSFFSVADNNLQGPIPTGGQFDTFPISSFQGNPELCGLILQRSCTGDPPSNSPLARGKRKKRVIVLTLSICSAIFTIILLLYCFLEKRWRRLQQQQQKRGLDTTGLDIDSEEADNTSLVQLFPNKNNNNNKIQNLTMAEILKATENFSQSHIIGCGGFGLVYQAVLENGIKLAIKKLSGDMCLVEREFKAEVEILSTAQHRNLVSLKGYCTHQGYRLLLYSYMENGSLDYWLHEKPGGAAQLSWPTRLKIALGAATGVAYMHQTCEPHIVHRDLKSSNILLDHNLEAHVADFGLARLILPYQTHVTTELVGTLGYIPPEYGQSWVATLRGDVYSFGVVMVELVTGKRPFLVMKPKGERELVKWVVGMRSEGRVEEVFDAAIRRSKLGFDYEGEMARVVEIACLCVNQNPMVRPTMNQVVDWINDVVRSRGTATTTTINVESDHSVAR